LLGFLVENDPSVPPSFLIKENISSQNQFEIFTPLCHGLEAGEILMDCRQFPIAYARLEPGAQVEGILHPVAWYYAWGRLIKRPHA
jgi:hypothetical protein